MRLDSVKLENFRCFEEAFFEFNRQFNVLIGDNGTGKTTVLRALAVLMAQFVGKLSPEWREFWEIAPEDVRTVVFHTESGVHIERQTRALVEGGIWAHGGAFSAGVTYQKSQGSTTHGFNGLAALEGVTSALSEAVASGESAALPLFAFYGTGRLWIQSTHDYTEPNSPGSRFAGYEQWSSPTTHVDNLVRWLKTQELIALQEGNSETVAFTAVKSAIIQCIPECTNIQYNIRAGELLVTMEGGQTTPFRLLSDGLRNMVAMAADIAWRAVTLNLHMGVEAPLKTAGLVLIDEIDLHLHPKWQRRVVDDLRRAFPELQFVATTHSPFIVQSLGPGELINLDGGASLPAEASIEEVAEVVMGVENSPWSQRHIRQMKAAEEYFELLESSKRGPETDRRLDELMIEFSNEPTTVAMLKARRAARDAGQK